MIFLIFFKSIVSIQWSINFSGILYARVDIPKLRYMFFSFNGRDELLSRHLWSSPGSFTDSSVLVTRYPHLPPLSPFPSSSFPYTFFSPNFSRLSFPLPSHSSLLLLSSLLSPSSSYPLFSLPPPLILSSLSPPPCSSLPNLTLPNSSVSDPD